MINLDELNKRLLGSNCVLGISLDMEHKSLKYNLVLTLAESEIEGAKKLIIYFYDVSELRLSEFGGGLTQFMHLKIVRNEFQHDRKVYSLSELCDEKISFSFADMDILS
ncbi:MAG: hypothetical protein ABJN40_14955 [Sneathiella sp.]